MQTGILPLTQIKSYVAIIDVEDPSFDTCKTNIMNYFRGMDINGAVFFQDRDVDPVRKTL